ncbi:uncharacterized protein (TIGR02678 family) [Streptomyces sp. 846.5]|nr:DUF2398 family protein [Streptomyces sp. 846.5]TDU05350.1 uncharacterized protein (TIGR02678 family) [Streptomyces sp. 846.5]
MRVAEDVSGLDLPEYQKAVRLLLNNPLVTAVHPNPAALPLLRRWAPQLRRDLGEVLGYALVSTGDTMRLRRAQDTLDGTRPAISRTRRPFDRRRYAYLALTLSALGRSGTQIALSEMADAVAADAGRVEGLGMDTGRKPDRDAFVDAVAWLEARGALRMADGSAVDWANDPDRAEALYDIDREVVAAVYQPSRVLQHLGSVTELLDSGSAGSLAVGGKEARRRTAARRARRLVLEQPVVYYADVDESLRGQLRAPALAEDLERLTGLELERRAEGVALIDLSRRLSDTAFPSGGTVPQSALLLCTVIAARVVADRGRTERLPAATAAERLQAAARRIDTALPDRGAAAQLLIGEVAEVADAGPDDDGGGPGDEAAYPFLSDAWLRGALRKLLAEFGAGMAEKQVGDPDRLLDDALALLASMGLLGRVDGGVLVLPLLARYRGATAQVRNRPRTPAGSSAPDEQQMALFLEPASEPDDASDPKDDLA